MFLIEQVNRQTEPIIRACIHAYHSMNALRTCEPEFLMHWETWTVAINRNIWYLHRSVKVDCSHSLHGSQYDVSQKYDLTLEPWSNQMLPNAQVMKTLALYVIYNCPQLR